MNFIHLTAGADDDGRRLDKIIRRFLNEESLSQLYGAIRKGLVKVDGKKRAPDFHVAQGSDIAIADFLARGNEAADRKGCPCESAQIQANSVPRASCGGNAMRLNTDMILFRNEHLLILNKPYDVPVQKARPEDVSLADMVTADYEAQSGKVNSLSFRPGPLHRLDRKTTGIIVFSQSLRGARWFSEAIRTHAVRKIYLTLLQGNLKNEETWRDCIERTEGVARNTDHTESSAKNHTSSDNFYTVTVGTNGKEARSVATPLAWGSYGGVPVTLAKIEIDTGRKHQIRSQAASHGFPLLGDTAYGGKRIHEEQDFFLHAHSLVIPENPLEIPGNIKADISTIFAKMSGKCLINFDSLL